MKQMKIPFNPSIIRVTINQPIVEKIHLECLFWRGQKLWAQERGSAGQTACELEQSLKQNHEKKQGCGSAFISSGSGSSILGWIPIRIQGFNDQNLKKKKYSWKKKKI
jgi:hypothetical protein